MREFAVVVERETDGRYSVYVPNLWLGNLCTGRFRARSASRRERKARRPTAYLPDTPRAPRRRRSRMATRRLFRDSLLLCR
jgi:hypothetical protein